MVWSNVEEVGRGHCGDIFMQILTAELLAGTSRPRRPVNRSLVGREPPSTVTVSAWSKPILPQLFDRRLHPFRTDTDIGRRNDERIPIDRYL
jgi:hypothetical protein